MPDKGVDFGPLPSDIDGGNWLDLRHYTDLDPTAERALRAAGLSWNDELEAERLLASAELVAPMHMAVIVAHYRYHFYKHRFPEALAYAAKCLCLLSAELALPDDFRTVKSSHADFVAPEERVRFWLFALQAYGYVLLRCGRTDDATAALRKVVELDPTDQTKTRILLDVIARAGGEQEAG
jgi:hypothetical protein